MTHSVDEPSPLERYGHNLTQLAQQGAFLPLAGSEAIVTSIFEILLRRQKTTNHHNRYNPIILDLEGTSRWPVIAEAIRRMAVGDAPDPLPTWHVIALNYEALLARTPEDEAAFKLAAPEPALPEEDDPALDEIKTWEDFEQFFKKYFPKGLWPPLEEWVAPDVVMQRLQALFLAVRQSEGQVLLFIDHFHRLLGGDPDRYPIYAFSLLKPTLARGEIQLIGACTLAEFRQWIEREQSLLRRWQTVCLPDTWDELERLRAQRASAQQGR